MQQPAHTHRLRSARSAATQETHAPAVTQAVNAERRRIERDLHDGTQQYLTSAMMILQQARAQLPGEGGSEAAELMALAMDRLLDTAQELRRVTRTIYPALLEQVGLVGALEGLIDRSALRIDLVCGSLPELSEAVELTAYFVTAEALANVAKHADSDRVVIRLATTDDGHLELSIADEGSGMVDERRGTGLRGLRERLRAEGGKLTVQGRPGRGSVVTARWPLALRNCTDDDDQSPLAVVAG